uniref:Uncharacterized protein n=1 Tax=Arundo donax TaxID=35708 RepID=A0A0A9BG85_ARUDO
MRSCSSAVKSPRFTSGRR